MLPNLPPPEAIAAIILVIFFAIGLHEYAHCKFAELAGDPTPRIYGRVTLNLTKHFEPLGTFMMIVSSMFGVGIGWGRPAPMDSRKMRNPRWDLFAAVAAGPISNVVQALLYAIVLRVGLHQGWFDAEEVVYAAFRSSRDFPALILSLGVFLNLSLALFNLIPLGPLDGHWLVAALLPDKQAFYWNKWHRIYGGQILIAVVLFSQVTHYPILSAVTRPALFAAFRVFTGVSLDLPNL